MSQSTQTNKVNNYLRWMKTLPPFGEERLLRIIRRYGSGPHGCPEGLIVGLCPKSCPTIGLLDTMWRRKALRFVNILDEGLTIRYWQVHE
jgi:hypothetical protein